MYLAFMRVGLGLCVLACVSYNLYPTRCFFQSRCLSLRPSLSLSPPLSLSLFIIMYVYI